jgi:hypothetical protein
MENTPCGNLLATAFKCNCPDPAPPGFLFDLLRDKIFAYTMRAPVAISDLSLLRRFSRGKHDRGRCPAC